VKSGFGGKFFRQSAAILTPEMWRVIAVVAAVSFGFCVRSAYVLKGYSALNSDEVMYYRALLDMGAQPGSSDFIDQFRFIPGVKFLFLKFFYIMANHHLEYMPFFASLVNISLYLLWMYVLIRRTGSFWSGFPLLVFLMFPTPSVSYMGTDLSEIRLCYFYGAILTLFAGEWFRNSWRCIAFGLVSSWGCWEDLFTIFFILPVLFYEKEALFSGTWINRFCRLSFVFLGTTWILLMHPENSRWMSLYRAGYFNLGIGKLSEWCNHGWILISAWPVYWFGGIPWGYLQSSQLGQWLNPGFNSFHWTLTPYFFWPLLGFTLLAPIVFFRSATGLKDIWLWLMPPILFVFFFIFGKQAWDALTLRYLSFWQLVPAIFLGLWMVSFRGRHERIFFTFVLGLWVLFNSVFLIIDFENSNKEHPGQRIAARLEQAGYRAGFSNYWVSEPVCYFSNDRVLLTPYNHSPISRKALAASRNNNEIALVWVDGLDRPSVFGEVVRQIESLGYRRISKSDFKEEGWSITGLRKIR
jgi:hypothetical protein